MAIVNVTGISGINSITAQSTSLNFYTAAGNNLPISAGTLNVGTGASVSSPATNVLTLGTNNIERIRVGAAGSIGIGTTNPLGVLAVSGGVSNPAITFQNGSATSAVTFSTTNNGLISTGGTQTATSGTISVTVPDASAVGATHTIPVTLPTGAVINNMRVTLNMTHTWISDMVINLKAPNGQVLNLFNQHGGSGDKAFGKYVFYEFLK